MKQNNLKKKRPKLEIKLSQSRINSLPESNHMYHNLDHIQ